MRKRTDCPACGGDGELVATGVTSLECRIRNATRIRSLYLAARRALQFVHQYRAECCARGEPWRQDRRVIACLEQVAAFRASVHALRHHLLVAGELAWCIECRGSGFEDNACEGCGEPVDLGTRDDHALERVGLVVHRGCDTGHAYFHPGRPGDLPLWGTH